jgi:hypothetical protein
MTGEDGTIAEWYYVGHYGQLGPLTFEQMSDLVADGVVERDTFVWKKEMSDWAPASTAPGLSGQFLGNAPPPSPGGQGSSPPVFQPPAQQSGGGHAPNYGHQPYSPVNLGNYAVVPKSDKNRIAAGVLNFFPGFGRFYLGYAAHGVLQLMTAFCGVGLIWSWLDGLFIMVGGVKYDGYGRVIDD